VAVLADDAHTAPGVTTLPASSIWQLAWPTVLTSLLQTTVGLVDIKAVGTLGTDAVAAATAGQRVFFTLQAMLMGVSVGTAALVARAWGAGNRDEAAHVMRSSMALAGLLALGMAVLGVLLSEPSARLFGLRADAYVLATIFMRWMSVVTLVFAIGFVLGSALRAAGDMRTPLVIGAIANLVNIAGVYLFVYGGLGAPKLGIQGAALSAGLGFSTASALLYWLWQSGRLRLPPAAADSQARTRMRAVLKVGAPAALEQLVVQGGFFSFTFIIARYYGTAALAAYGIGVQILSLSFVVGFGFSIAASTLVGQHLGAGEPELAMRSGWRAMRLAVGCMSLLSVVIIYWARPIAAMMISDPHVVDLTVRLMILLGLAQPLMAIDFALSGALRGAGDTRFPLLSTFLGLICGRVLLSTLFTIFHLPVDFVYGALLADYAIKSQLLAARFRSQRWQGEPASKLAHAG
jgi:putative MATE family efflux protein